MNKNKNYLNQGLLVAAAASFLGKTSFTFRISFIIFSIYLLINLIKLIKRKSSRLEIFTMLSALICSIYFLGGSFKEQFNNNYIVIYKNSFSYIINIIFIIIMILSLFVHSYMNIAEDNKESWLKFMKAISIVILIVLAIIGLLYIVFP